MSEFAYKDDYMFYDDLNYSIQTEDLAFYKKIIKNNKNILEVACGTGRIISNLYKNANYILGLDNSNEMLSVAKLKISSPKVEFLCENMTNLESVNKKFDYIICGYNSLQHLLNNEDLEKFLKGARELLNKDGILIIDIFNPNPQFLNIKKIHEYKCDFYSNYKKSNIIVEEERVYNPNSKINYITYIYKNNLGNVITKTNAKMKQYYDGDIEKILEKAKLKLDIKYGDYSFHKFHNNSPKQIFIIRKEEI